MNALNIRKTLNKAFLKVKPQRSDINEFKHELLQLLQRLNPTEHEEFNKNLLADFLKNTAFGNAHFINTKGRNDLVIHHDKSPKSPVGVILECKRPENTSEMPRPAKSRPAKSRPAKSSRLSRSNDEKNGEDLQYRDFGIASQPAFHLNTKAIQELVLYYLRERITDGNKNIKHLIATDGYTWFVFDEQEFYKHFASDKKLVKAFKEFERGTASGTNTDYFYKNIAAPAIEKAEQQLTFTYFDLREEVKKSKTEDRKLIPLFKILSPEHLLKLPFANDSNTLDKKFYAELLHLIGLHEVGNSKKTIERLPEGKRLQGSLLENTIEKLDSTNKIHRLKHVKQYGETYQEQLETVALELVITWVNRILFLKLLEAQLLTYHKGNKEYAFLNYDKLRDYDEVEVLFFEVLAKPTHERSDFNNKTFGNVPYLNSSLFEPTELESNTIEISGLRDRYDMPLHSATVLKDANGKRQTGERNTLDYLFAFLDAYDFASEGTEDIQEQQKSIINAAVLGLIFEKINGYKDGSFFTPGFITMYMCRETLRRAVVQKFNDAKGWNCKTLDDIYDKIDDRNEANAIVNSLKICDPAVGSGHFLVSALNELIAIKADLRILQDLDGKRIKEYRFEVINDELVVTDEDEDTLFEYKPNSRESQRIQQMLFHEKQTIIENCLFGVDINPNSVKICRLRLWIELLKNAYYKDGADLRGLPDLVSLSGHHTKREDLQGLKDLASHNPARELETLPNIDINIKCGNSLISRFALDADLKKALKKHKYSIDAYRVAVATYRNARTKEEKWAMLDLINTIKKDFKTSISANSKEQRQLAKLGEQLYYKYNSSSLFEAKLTKAQEHDKQQLEEKITKLQTKIHEIENNKIYQNAFEWRFEFPEVLDEDGGFVGFDVVIGNPPYAVVEKKRNSYLQPYKSIHEFCNISKNYDEVLGGKLNLYRLFIKRAFDILKKGKDFGFIIPLTLIGDNSLNTTRKFVFDNFNKIQLICFPQKDNAKKRVFEDAKQSTLIILGKRDYSQQKVHKELNVYTYPYNSFDDKYKFYKTPIADIYVFDKLKYSIPLVSQKEWKLLKKLHENKLFRDFKEVSIRRGEINQTIYRKFITREVKTNLIKGVEIGLYKTNQKLSQGVKEYFDEQEFLKTGKENNFSNIRRIATQRITGTDERLRIVASIINPKAYFADSTNSISLDLDSKVDLSLEYILGILNSKLMQWRFKKTSSNNNVSTTELYSLPFKFNPEIKIEEKVTQILTLKKSDPTADTSALEAEIDKLVYALYGLTAEEIAIVEGDGIG